ncbi:MAG: homocysteine S-methyltransferase family protein [Candidatus Aminicenantes bacterium]|nr:homocysteine S-methyltransferase family protein [Candidatus Aminicenantes bacterium]
MASSPILDLMARRTVLFDGAIGTELMKRGFDRGGCPELLNVEEPSLVQSVHRDYFAAGSDVVSTNSFGGSPLKLAAFGLAGRAQELNRAAARIAVEVRPPGRYVAGSLGSTGKFLQPQGELTEAEMVAQFAVQALGLAEGGADILIIETMFDLREALAAVRGARAAAGLPVFATLTFNRTPRGFFTLMGDSPEKCVRALEAEDVQAFGSNCTLTSGDMVDLAAEFRRLTPRPLIFQANAGRPELGPDGTVSYSQSVEDYVQNLPRLVANGASAVGGCCGTNPEYIRRMAAVLESLGR